ncbi:Rieske 2Fe-2S domain-containing protein [Sphingomonas sp. VDB2]|uniref:Rieske 2Fe-2S domain-containing protein n=1 Tax=Sphingomonas sp. VDB2 TaxID=3228751 RepID=UPI003A7F78B2
MADYPQRCWYMAGWADELGEGGFSREIRGERLFVLRTADGVAALRDRCPHRFAPLSLGTRDGDRVVCGYHGLAFAPDGRCVHNPFADRIPAGASVPAFHLVERDGILWLWGGDRQDADETLIPDFGFIPDTHASRTVRGYTLMQAQYEYGTDNLLDLSHIEFVHKGTFAGQGVIFAGRHKAHMQGDTLHSDWWMPGIAPPSVARGHVPDDAVVDHWLEMRWNAPASMRLMVGVCPHGGPRDTGFEVPQAHILTPANDHQSHYFWSSTRYDALDSPETDAALLRLFGEAFDQEDKPMIEAAYANMAGCDFWAEKPLSLGIDQGGTRARRLVEAMIAREKVDG